jgi:murein DD-endopeptidase MepM/ murein hydrolase activator NlpD
MDGNTNVYSVMDGQISAIEKNPSGESGRYVFVNHNDELQTRYFHGESIPEGLRVGMPVTAGDMIMVAGQSGRSNGPHLHFEIGKLNDREFVQMDPMTALPNVFENYVLSDDLSLMKASTF